MSTEDENSTIPESHSDAVLPVEKAIILNCCICTEVIENDDIKASCKCDKCGKSTCATCLEKLIDLVFNQPTLSYPVKCMICSHRFDQTRFDEIIVRKDYYDKFIACVLPLYWSQECLEENEKLASCPFCPYLEIHTTDACPLHILTCQNPSCRKKSCLICLHAIDDENLSIHQSRCLELRSCKQMIEDAIDSGSKQHCPHCQLTGLKDDGCTHMVCQRCEHPWCYVCGAKEDECKVPDDVEPSLSAHNTDWDSNEDRCPMSLLVIHELDVRWPHDDRACLEYFHRYRTLSELSNVLKLVGEDKFNEINHHFGTIDASGYTIEEIKRHENQKLIEYTSIDTS